MNIVTNKCVRTKYVFIFLFEFEANDQQLWKLKL